MHTNGVVVGNLGPLLVACMGAFWFVIDAVGKRLQRVHCRPFAAPVLIRSKTYPAPAPFQAAATRVCTPLGFSDLNYPASGKSAISVLRQVGHLRERPQP